jgi:hypothetical protein
MKEIRCSTKFSQNNNYHWKKNNFRLSKNKLKVKSKEKLFFGLYHKE